MAAVGTVYPPEIWALESLMVLRDNLVMARLIHRDFEDEVSSYGDVVRTRKPEKLTAASWSAQADTCASTAICMENLHAKNLSITLDTLKYTAFLVDDKDAATSMHNLRDEFILPAMDPISQAIDDDIMSEFTSAASTDVEGNAVSSSAYDTVGLGADMNEDDIIKTRQDLNTAQCPFEGRKIVLCTEHEADCLRSNLFVQSDQAGSSEALVNANLGRKFGFDTYMSQNVPTAADTDSTPQSLAFHRNAICLVTRPLAGIPPGLGALSGRATIDGISIRVVTSYEPRYKGVCVSFDVLYGTQLLDANLARIINP